MFFDSHAHLDDESFSGDRNEVAATLLNSNLAGVMNVSSSISNFSQCVAFADSFENVYAAIGIHPHEAKHAENDIYSKITSIANNKKVKAYGEIGLDYHYDFSPREKQKAVFEEQIGIASELKLPIIIHSREAHGDMLDTLRIHKAKILGGVMHMYSGSWDMAKKLMDLGLYISLGGPVTFKNAVSPIEIAKNIPLSSLMIETDCPYMSPHPLRGKRNVPGNVGIIADKIAQIKNISIEEVALSTTKNAIELFKITI